MFVARAAVVPDPNPDFPPFAWEETACPLCGGDCPEPVAEAADYAATGAGLRFAVVRCRHCSLAYTNPRPTADTISRFYPERYPPHAPDSAGRGRLGSGFWTRVLGYPAPERRGLLPCPPGRLLDFGCGGGSYLRRMAALGWSVVGLDTSEEAIRQVRDGIDCEAIVGSLPHPSLTPGSFDVVTMWQSLEHVHRPLDVLREALRVLVPGGYLVVAVPNFASRTRGWFGEHWYGYDLPRHLTHFTRATLADMLRAAGFRVQAVRGLVRVSWTRAGARRALAAGGGGVVPRAVRWRPAARLLSWWCYATDGAEALVAVARRPE